MTEEENCVAIEITKEVPFFGEGDSLANRLKNVVLRGFPNVKIYEKAKFEQTFLTPEQIQSSLHTPQPNVYQDNLKKVGQLAKLFSEKGIDITNLEKAYDFIAKSQSGIETQWTIIPPVIERWHIPKTAEGKFNYEPLLGEEVRKLLAEQNLGINPDLSKLNHSSESCVFDLINDGAHRVFYGFQNKGIKIMRIEGITPGFPYYAAPQKYEVKLMPFADEVSTAMKIHVVQSPAQKLLYRNFPSGGIMSGQVRPATTGEKFI
jgi:hypothetical protein